MDGHTPVPKRTWIMKRGHGVGRGCGVKGVQEELNGAEGLIQSNTKNDYTHTHTYTHETETPPR